MMKGVKIVTLLLLSVLFLSCRKEEVGKDLTIIFATTTGLAGDGYNEPILKALMESVSAQPGMTIHMLKPDNLSEARSQFDEWLSGADERKALVLCGPEFEPLVEGVSLEKGRILLLDSDKTYGDRIATARLKRYGGAWLAGAIMKDFELVLLKGLDGDRIIDEISQGIEDGYKENGGAGLQKYVLSSGYDGLDMADELYSILWEQEVVKLFYYADGIIAPVCGTSRLGAFDFSWRYYATIGVGDDCSPYTDILPFSLILDLGGILKEYVSGWAQNSPWPAHADYGMSTGHVYISFNDRFFEHYASQSVDWTLSLDAWTALENQYRDKALEKEAEYAY